MGLKVEHPDHGPMWLSFEYTDQLVERKDKMGRPFTSVEHWAVDAVLETSDHIEIAHGTAVKHPKDHFVKETGRQVAMKKLIAQLKALNYPGSFLRAVHETYENRHQRYNGYGAGI